MAQGAASNALSQPVYLTSPIGLDTPSGGATDPQYYSRIPSGDTASSITPVVGAGVSQLLIKASAGNFYGGSVVNNTTAGYLIAYNANTIPASGAALSANLVLGMNAIAANGVGSIDPATVPDRFNAGMVLLFSTSPTTFTIPGTLPFFMKGRGV